MKRLSKEEFFARYKDPRWQKKRLEILQRDEWTCRKCFSKEKTLHVHHSFYEPGSEPWEYEDASLITLCEQCHESEPSEMRSALSELELTLKSMGWLSTEIAELAVALQMSTLTNANEVLTLLSRYSWQGQAQS